MWKLFSSLFLGWSLGANDSANVFGTGVTTGTVKYRTAIILTACFALLGASIEGPKCMQTVSELSRLMVYEAFWCTFSAAVTMTVLTFLGIPASCSQAIIGAVVGVGILSGSADFSKLYKILSCWVLTPVSSFIAAYMLYRLLAYSLDRAKINLARRNLFYFWGIILAGCYGAYSLGSNNVANVTGVYVGSGMLSPDIASFLGGLSIVIGVLTYSKKVMMTIGKGIVPLDPFSGLVVVLAEAATLHLFTQIGVPVSSSQAVVGAVVGVGIIGGLKTVSLRMLAKIGTGWILTPVSAGVMANLFARFVI